MDNKARLANIYIKIHNKLTLTISDLEFLSKYDPECFEKTCKNVLYKIPEVREIVTVKESDIAHQTKKGENISAWDKEKAEIETILARIRQMEVHELMVHNVSVEHLKEVIGTIYMEEMFPHNDHERYFSLEAGESGSIFNMKA